MKSQSAAISRSAGIALSLAILCCGPLAHGATAAAPGAQPEQAPLLVKGLPDFADLVDQVGPVVVNIRTVERVAPRSPDDGEMDDDVRELFRRFFGGPPPEVPRANPKRGESTPGREVPRGVGSGFIISDDGYIMTNAHVIEHADGVVVTLNDQREFKAKVVGADRRTDVAVLKIDAKGLPAARIGDVSRLRVGEWVMAIGSPFDLDNTVTAGIVSAKHRDTGEYLPFIQTDVAVNPGNSGGPLINMRGEVVGINSQIYSRSGGFMGISFAIPIDEAMRVGDQLKASGHVTRGRIGVRIDRVSPEVAESIGLGKSRGALVRGVEPGSPAAVAGVEPGDIVVAFGGKPVESATDLPRMVGATAPGAQSSIQVFRRGKTHDLKVVVAELEPQTSGATRRPVAERKAPDNKPSPAQSMGLTVMDLTAEQRAELKIPNGVLVQAAIGAAASAGLRKGDVILAVGNSKVEDVHGFDNALAKLDRRKVTNMLVQRDDMVQFVLVPPKG